MPSRRDPTSPRPPARRRKAPGRGSPKPAQVGPTPPSAADRMDLSGPWKVEPVPNRPGAVAVLREWESQERGDDPEAVFLDEDVATAFAALLPHLDREPVLSLFSVLTGGRPAAAPPQKMPAPLLEGSAAERPTAPADGGQGSQHLGWLRRRNPQMIAALGILELLVRSPKSVVALLSASDGALELVRQDLMSYSRPN